LNNIKTTIAIAGAAVAAALAVYFVQQQKLNELRLENEALKQQVAQIAPLQEQLASAAQAAAGGAAAKEGQTLELARLRNEVSQLRKSSNDLAKARQQIQTLNQRVAAEVEAGKGALAQAQAQAQAETQKIQNANACINNLRLLDSAKLQWAQQNGKQATDTPAMEDLRPYFKPNGVAPACPDGGVYTLGAVSEKATCSIPGHVVP
jgi:chromosome segregation ATPase